jgi:hypothetical protein
MRSHDASRGRTPWILLTVVLLLGTPVLAGCGADDTTKAGPSGPMTSQEVSSPASPIPSVPLPTATSAVEWAGAATTRAAVLTGIRTIGTEGMDRLVLEFDQPVAGYRVDYVPSVYKDPSGEAVDLEGQAVLQVIVQNATTDNSYQAGGEIPASRYAGPLAVRPALPVLVDIQRIGDFESVLGFGLGLTSKVKFSVSRVEDPFRIVIDLAHQ